MRYIYRRHQEQSRPSHSGVSEWERERIVIESGVSKLVGNVNVFILGTLLNWLLLRLFSFCFIRTQTKSRLEGFHCLSPLSLSIPLFLSPSLFLKREIFLSLNVSKVKWKWKRNNGMKKKFFKEKKSVRKMNESVSGGVEKVDWKVQ